MKNLITTILLSTMMTAAFAGIIPGAKIINTDDVIVTSQIDGLFETASFNSVNETMQFTTVADISVIQIVNADGELEFQLPVMSNNVQINKNLFGQGDFKLGFIMEGQDKIHFTKVEIK